MTEDVLKAIHAKTNAIDAVNAALAAEWAMLEELSKLLEAESPDIGLLRDGVAALRSLNSALPAAVVANVAPATAGPVGKSPQQQIIDSAEQVIADALPKVADAAKQAEAH